MLAKAKTNRDEIVAVAIAMLDEEGLDAVSLHRIAAAIGIKTPSLYKHIASKSELYRLMSDQIFTACLTAIPSQPDWESWLRSMATSLWQRQSSTEGILGLIAANRADGGEPTEPTLVSETLQAFGLREDDAAALQASIQAYVTGWTTMHPPSIPQSEAEFYRGLDAFIVGWKAALGGDLLA